MCQAQSDVSPIKRVPTVIPRLRMKGNKDFVMVAQYILTLYVARLANCYQYSKYSQEFTNSQYSTYDIHWTIRSLLTSDTHRSVQRYKGA